MALNIGELFATIDLRDKLLPKLGRSIGELRANTSIFRGAMQVMREAAEAMGSAVTEQAKRAAVAIAQMVANAVVSGSSLEGVFHGVTALFGSLSGVIGRITPVASLFGLSMSRMGIAARLMESETGRSVLKTIVILVALGVAATIIARKIRENFDQIAPVFERLRPAALVASTALRLIGVNADSMARVIGRASAAYNRAMTSLSERTEDTRKKIGTAFDRIGTAVQWLNRLMTTIKVVTGATSILTSVLGGMTTAMGTIGGATLSATPIVAGFAVKSAAALAGVGAAGVAAGAVGALALTGIVAGLGAIGVKAAMTAPAVKKSFADLGKSVKTDLAEAASGLEGPLIAASGRIKSTFSAQIAPALRGVFTQIAPLIGQFTTGLTSMLGPLLPAVQGITGAVTPMLSQLAGSLGTFGGQLAGFLAPVTQAFSQSSGFLAQLVTGLGGVLQALGPLLGALVQLGAALVGPLMGALTQVAGALSSALGPVLVQMAPQIGQIVASLGMLLASLMPLLPPILQLVGTLASALMPVLVQVATAVTTALRPVLVQMGPLLGQIAMAFGQLIVALLPLLPPIAQLVASLATALLPALAPIIPIIGQVAATLGGILVQAVTILLGALTPMLPMLSQMAQMFGAAIMQALQQLSPALMQIVAAFSGLLPAVLPILPPLVQLATSLLPPIIQLVVALTPILTTLINIFTGLVGAILPFLPPLIQIATSVVPLMVSVITALVQVLRGDFSGALETIKGAVVTFGTTIMNAFKKLFTLGKDLVDGIKQGFVNAWNSFTATVGSLFSGFIGWIKKLLGIASPSKVMASIGSDTAKGWLVGLMAEQPKIKETAGALVDTVVNAFKSGKISDGVKDGLVESIRHSNSQLQDLAEERKRIVKIIADAMAYVKQINDQVKQFASLGNMQFGEEGPTAESIKQGLQAKLAQVRAFAGVIKKLAKRGLSKSLLQQVIEAGPDAGTELGQAILAADSSTFKAINSTAGMIDKAAKDAGKAAADAMFDAGRNAGKGFLTGLTSQKKEIIKAMQDIANALVTQIKKALKIKSPSGVFAEIGMFTMAGLESGITVGSKKMLGSAATVAGKLADTFGSQVAVPGGQVGPAPARYQNTTTVHVTNHYPQAEPTSRTVNRGLQYAAVVGLA
ncbi:phage tail protein [Sphaerisporangium sp. NPDC004334]